MNNPEAPEGAHPLESLLAAIPLGVQGLDAAGRIRFQNAAARSMLGYSDSEAYARCAHELIHHHRRDGSPYPRDECPIHRTIDDGVPRHVDDETFVRKDGSDLPVEYSVVPTTDAEGTVTGAVLSFRDMSGERLETERRALEVRVLDMISAGAPLPWILEVIARAVDEMLPPVRASILLVEDGRLRHGAAPQLPDAFNRAVDGVAIGEGVGSCGTAAWRQSQVITSDIQVDPLWEGYRELADAHGLRACWSTPVVGARDLTIATFALYYATPRSPAASEMEFIGHIAHYVRVAIERTREQKWLARREAQYQSIFNLVSVAIWEEDWSRVVDRMASLRRDGVTDLIAHFESHEDDLREAFWSIRVIDANDRAVEMLDAPDKEALIASNLGTVYPGNVALVEFRRDLAAFIERKPVHQAELRMQTMTGRPLHVLQSLSYPDPHHSPGRVLVSVMDISDRVEAEERFRVVAQAAGDAVWDWNLATDRIWWNDGFDRVFGRFGAEVTDTLQYWIDRVHPEDRDRTMEGVNAAIERGDGTWRAEYRFQRADGEYADVAEHGIILRDANGTPIRMVGTTVDVTEQRLLEKQLRQAHRLDAVGQLTGGVAHDFNNLLTVILGSAELLTDALLDRPDLHRLAEVTGEAAQRGAELTSRLLAFARQQALSPASTDVNRLLEDLDRLLRRSIGGHVELRLERAADLWNAMVDLGQLENAVLNLCINARDAMPDGGQITIETANTRIDEVYPGFDTDVTPGDYVMVSVSDTGCGMDQETMRRAFEPFFTTKEPGKGSGMGLSMVYGFARQSGGHARIYSEPGEGTAVRLYLPRAEGEAATEDQVESPMEAGGTETILLVEDDDLVRAHVRAQLNNLGYRVIDRANGRDALAVLQRSEKVDLLFTDVVMPGGMNGRVLADEARRLHPELPILFTSGYSESVIVHHGRLDPGVQLLSKPYRRSDLARRLRELLD